MDTACHRVVRAPHLARRRLFAQWLVLPWPAPPIGSLPGHPSERRPQRSPLHASKRAHDCQGALLRVEVCQVPRLSVAPITSTTGPGYHDEPWLAGTRQLRCHRQRLRHPCFRHRCRCARGAHQHWQSVPTDRRGPVRVRARASARVWTRRRATVFPGGSHLSHSRQSQGLVPGESTEAPRRTPGRPRNRDSRESRWSLCRSVGR